jgi:hypothetical protein
VGEGVTAVDQDVTHDAPAAEDLAGELADDDSDPEAGGREERRAVHREAEC